MPSRHDTSDLLFVLSVITVIKSNEEHRCILCCQPSVFLPPEYPVNKYRAPVQMFSLRDQLCCESYDVILLWLPLQVLKQMMRQ